MLFISLITQLFACKTNARLICYTNTHTFIEHTYFGTRTQDQSVSSFSETHQILLPRILNTRKNIIVKYSQFCLNLLKPTGNLMHQQFNIQQLHLRPHCIYVFCIYLRTNSDLCHLQRKLIGFYNRGEKCLLRGTNWVFK